MTAARNHPRVINTHAHRRMPVSLRMAIWLIVIVALVIVAVPIIDAASGLADAARDTPGLVG